MEGKYKYRNEEPARVLCVDYAIDGFPAISMDKNGVVRAHRIDGSFLWRVEHVEDDYDLIPDIPIWEGELVRRPYRPTPYTDEQARAEGCWGEESCVPADFARGLERGRDAARDVAHWLFVRLRAMAHDFDQDGIRERCAELAEEYAWLDSQTNAESIHPESKH